MSRHFAAALTIAVGALLIGNARPAYAIPLLQLYVEGATYDPTTETWFKEFSPGDEFVIWAIGNVDGPGSKGTIEDVKMSIAYEKVVDGLSRTITLGLDGTTTGNLGNFDDPSTPADGVHNDTTLITDQNDDSQLPQLSDGGVLPKHGQYVNGIEWQEFLLGDFSLIDSPIADFITSFPVIGVNAPLDGQINAYQVNVSSSTDSLVRLHFDLYNHYQAQNGAKAVFAPFSHDAEGTPPGEEPPPVVPEPGTFVLMALGGLGLGAFRRRRKAVEA